MKDYYETRLEEVEEELEKLPKGTLVYKTIKGKKQPYLQWTSGGRSHSMYIRLSEREHILVELERRSELQEERKRLLTYSREVLEILEKNPFLTGGPGVGIQDFEHIREWGALYVDKTDFIREWWENNEEITLIARPRRFGKTLMLSTINYFFSTEYVDKKAMFEKLAIWKEEKYRRLQGTMPVIFITLSPLKHSDFEGNLKILSNSLQLLYLEKGYLIEGDVLKPEQKAVYEKYLDGLSRGDQQCCEMALKTLSYLMSLYHGQKVLILMDEYDTPLQEAYLGDCWDEMTSLMRELFQNTFKSNPYLSRALLTGITRITKESLFSDMNHLDVVTMTTPKYEDAFGFTESEVVSILKCQGLDTFGQVKEWYDGFTIGERKDIYNPWSIVNYVDKHQFRPYWADSGGTGLITRLVLRGKLRVKQDLEVLLQGGSLHKRFDENICFHELDYDSEAIWPLLLAAGYLRADHVVTDELTECDLTITNRETMACYAKMVRGWFVRSLDEYNEFSSALLKGDLETMNEFMNYVTLEMVSFFDVGNRPSEKAPERFYHGLVLGMIVDLKGKYRIRSNRESGRGRYDIMLYPLQEELDGIIIEFKVRDEKKEPDLDATVANALRQIEEKRYEEELMQTGLPKDRIRKYGFAFEGKEVLIRENQKTVDFSR